MACCEQNIFENQSEAVIIHDLPQRTVIIIFCLSHSDHQRGCFKIGCRPWCRASPEKKSRGGGGGGGRRRRTPAPFFLPQKIVLSVHTRGIKGYRLIYDRPLWQASEPKTNKQTNKQQTKTKPKEGVWTPYPPPLRWPVVMQWWLL